MVNNCIRRFYGFLRLNRKNELTTEMIMQVDLNRISAPPGQSVIVSDVNIAKFEQFLIETGDERHNRMLYYQGVLEMKGFYFGQHAAALSHCH